MEKSTDLKTWIEHSEGFINIDKEFMYFTNSGNWADAHQQKEYDGATNFRPLIFYTIIVIFFYIGSGIAFTPGNVTLLGIIGLGIGLYNFKQEQGKYMHNTFKVRHENIKSISIDSNQMSIIFKYGKNRQASMDFKKLDGSKIQELKEVSQRINPSSLIIN